MGEKGITITLAIATLRLRSCPYGNVRKPNYVSIAGKQVPLEACNDRTKPTADLCQVPFVYGTLSRSDSLRLLPSSAFSNVILIRLEGWLQLDDQCRQCSLNTQVIHPYLPASKWHGTTGSLGFVLLL